MSASRPRDRLERTPGAPDNPKAERPLRDLVSELTAELGTLVRKEIQLARLELKDDARQAARAGSMMGGAAFAGYLAAVLFSFGLAFLFDLFLPTWLAFVIVALLFGVVAWVLFQQGRERAKAMKPGPEQTVQSVKEDVEWLKTQSR